MRCPPLPTGSGGRFFFFLVNSWAVSTEPQSTRVVVVLTFDSPRDFAELHKVITAIRASPWPNMVSPIHVATHEVADRVLAEFSEGRDDCHSSTAL